MTTEEICKQQEANGNREMYLQQQGCVWHAYEGGALVLHRLTGYRLRQSEGSGVLTLEFSDRVLSGVLIRMHTGGLSITHYDEAARLIAFTTGLPFVPVVRRPGS